MIRRLLLGACLALAGCGPALEQEYQAARQEFLRGHLPAARQRIDACEARAGTDPRQRWRFRLLQAEVLLALGEVAEARALVDRPGAPDAALELRRSVILANIRSRGPKPADILPLLHTLDATAARLGQAGTGREIANIRGNILMDTGQLAASEKELARAAASARAEGDDYWLSVSLVNLSYLKSRLRSRHEEAVRLGEEGIRAASRAGAERLLAASLGNTSMALALLGEFDRAVNYRQQALELQRRVADRQQIRESLTEVGNLFAFQNRPVEAVKWYRQAFDDSEAAGSPADAGRAAGNLAFSYIELGRWDEAERWNRRATELKRAAKAPLLRQTQNEALIAEGRGHWGEAQRLYAELLDAARSEPRLLLEARSGLGRIAARRGDAAAARRHFEAAVHLIESSRDAIARTEYQITFLARMLRTWGGYIDFLMSRGQIDAALAMAERSRANVLAQRLRTAQDRAGGGLELDRLRQIAARRRCAFLSFWLGPERSYVWTLDASGLRARTLPPAGEIGALASAWQQRIENQPGDPLQTGRRSGERLAELLLADVNLASTGRLVVVPDGSLHQVNLESLPLPGEQSYLLDRAMAVVAPSLSMVTAGGSSPRVAGEWLLVSVSRAGDPAYEPLPKVEDEVRAIASQAGPRKPVILTDGAATPAAIRELDLRRFGLIHLAAHAEANRSSPLESAVVLARSGDECRLYAREIAGIRLEAGLVTLSACRSAGARAYSGEGLLGLTWAVLSAGAANVIAGLWPVSDRATSVLMQDLYAEVGRGLSPAAALYQAKLKMRRSSAVFGRPYYWAPFQVYARGSELF